jgi:hypothetical protein
LWDVELISVVVAMNGRLKIRYSLTLGWEIWTIDYKEKKKSTELDFLGRAARTSGY